MKCTNPKCGKDLIGLARKFCSKKCRVRASNDRRNVERRLDPLRPHRYSEVNRCVICGCEYQAYRLSDKYCGTKCSKRAEYEHNRDEILARTKAWAQNNSDKRKNIRQKWDEANKEWKKAYYNKNRNKFILANRKYRAKNRKGRTITILKHCNHCNDYFKRDSGHWYIHKQHGIRDGVARVTTKYECKERQKQASKQYHAQNPDIKRKSKQKAITMLAESYVREKTGDKEATFPELYLKRNLLKLHRSIKQAQL